MLADYWNSLHFNGHFPGEPGLPVFIEAKDDGGGGDNWTAGAISRAKLQSNYHHQQTNIQFFTGRMPFLSPNQQCQITGSMRQFCNYIPHAVLS